MSPANFFPPFYLSKSELGRLYSSLKVNEKTTLLVIMYLSGIQYTCLDVVVKCKSQKQMKACQMMFVLSLKNTNVNAISRTQLGMMSFPGCNFACKLCCTLSKKWKGYPLPILIFYFFYYFMLSLSLEVGQMVSKYIQTNNNREYFYLFLNNCLNKYTVYLLLRYLFKFSRDLYSNTNSNKWKPINEHPEFLVSLSECAPLHWYLNVNWLHHYIFLDTWEMVWFRSFLTQWMTILENTAQHWFHRPRAQLASHSPPADRIESLLRYSQNVRTTATDLTL